MTTSLRAARITVCTVLFALLGGVVVAALPASARSNSSAQSPLYGVSCATRKSCMAVGRDDDGHPLAERWNGHKWKTVRTAAPKNGLGVLTAVSCVSKKRCIAVGYQFPADYQTATMSEVWNGHKWSLLKTPTRSTVAYLSAVSCVSASRCVAVGRAGSDSGFAALATTWNGRKWTTTNVASPSDGASTNLQGLSCAAANSCVAVGYAVAGSQSRTFAAHWDGSTWTLTDTPNPAVRGGLIQLTSVSCPETNACTAVGLNYSGSSKNGSAPVTMRWDGSSWTLVSTPRAGRTGLTGLLGVSCASATKCVAVGRHGATLFENSGDALAQVYTGNAWHLVKIKNPKHSPGSQLFAVTCLSKKRCTAVGESGPLNQTGHAMAAAWNGRGWKNTHK